ncbi:MAG: DUF934 domain-containing protein [Gammaproteobacteria bacterium]|nr:DUF934 domain-containing protein [Gammaproteobacteria bacterium]
MHVIKNRQIVQDNWGLLDDDAALPVAGDVIVSLRRWTEDREALGTHAGDVGVCISGDDELEVLLPELISLPLIALYFPKFVDGRNYSNARLLRERYSYRGELRAVGDVQRDQLHFMARCGIDSFELAPDQDVDAALKGLDDFSLSYQPAADQRRTVFQLRR